VKPATAAIWRGSLRPADAGEATSARLVAYTPGLPRLLHRPALAVVWRPHDARVRALLDQVGRASTRAHMARDWLGHAPRRGYGEERAETRTHLRPLGEWLRGGR